MNGMLIPTGGLALVLFVVGMRAGRTTKGCKLGRLLLLGLGLSLPGIIFAVYYLKILGEPIWLYQFRSLPGSELSASGAGFLAGLLHGKFAAGEQFRRITGAWFFPGILGLGLLIPYFKPLLRPPNWKQFQDRWSEGVCLQTSESSCGPACAATLLRRAGKTATEPEIARASFTSRNGTENWYLARTLRRYGLQVRFVLVADLKGVWPVPSIAGVRLPASGNAGHFITVLDRTPEGYVIGDPLEGRLVRSQAELRDTYEFTGFFMVVTPDAASGPQARLNPGSPVHHRSPTGSSGAGD